MTDIADARGLLCPEPLILAKKTLNQTTMGEKFIILIDNETSKQNVERFLRDQGAGVFVTRKDNVFELTVTKGRISDSSASAEPLKYCSLTAKAGHVLCFKSSLMGSGSEDLGKILIQACINTIPETEPAPKSLVFYNSGILLACGDSPVIPALKKLEEKGVKILVCGTCLDFYGKKQELKAGKISNMYDILSELSGATHVVYP